MGEINEKNYPAFKEAYLDAVEAGKEMFYFEDQEIMTNYAKYVVQYVENRG